MQKASETAAILAVVDPDANTAGTITTAWIPAKNYHKFMAIVMAGDLGTSGTLDCKIQQATDASGTGAKDITGKAITQLTQAGTDSNKQAIINLDAESLDVDNSFTHIALVFVTAVATGDSGAVLLGLDPRNGPASDNDVSTVDEIV